MPHRRHHRQEEVLSDTMTLTPRTFVCVAAALASVRVAKRMLMSRFFNGEQYPITKMTPEPFTHTLVDLTVSALASKRVYEPPESFFEGRDSITGKDAISRARFLECAPATGEDAEAYAWLVPWSSFRKSVISTEFEIQQDEERERDGENGSSALTLYVVFRGTESREDMLTNLDLFTEEFFSKSAKEDGNEHHDGEVDQPYVHSGFLDQFRALEPRITEYLSKHGTSCSRVVFAGHSLGGALATIATLYYATRQFRFRNFPSLPFIYCHTFGSPRVGDEAFCAAFERYVHHLEKNDGYGDGHESTRVHHWRVFDYEDPVPMVPISCRFTHVMKNTLCIGDRLRSRVCRTRDTHWCKRPICGFFRIDLFDPIGAHDCDRYFGRLSSLVRWRSKGQASVSVPGNVGGSRYSVSRHPLK